MKARLKAGGLGWVAARRSVEASMEDMSVLCPSLRLCVLLSLLSFGRTAICTQQAVCVWRGGRLRTVTGYV